jgi:DNA invertase Pin-like site-specific DNA recombinase
MTAYQVRPRTALPRRCLKKLEPGDTLIVWKLDRLGRSLRDLITMLDELKRRKVKFRSLTEPSTPTRRRAAPCGK